MSSAIDDMVDIALEQRGDDGAGASAAPSDGETPPPALARISENDGTTPGAPASSALGETPAEETERDSAPLMTRATRSVGGGMIALEVSSSGDALGEDLVLDDDRWRWRHTVSYWVCITYILGSLLFVAGCAFWYKRYAYESRKRALVTYPFLFGSVLFTLGGYLGLFQAINVGRRGRSVYWEWAPEKDGFLGYLYYFIGAAVFNISCMEPLAMFAGLPPWMKREMAWGAAEIGSAFFIAGAYAEVRHNRCLDIRECAENGRWKTLPFWLSWNNLSGGCLFFLAACAGRFDPESPGWVYTTYLIGSVNFFVASSVMLYMWKGEQYGLGFIPSINRLVPLRSASGDGKAYRRVSVLQYVFLQLYIVLTGASFIDFCFATQRFGVYSQYHGFAHFHEAIASLMGVFMSVGLLVMASVLHHTPRIHPFDKLLYWVQIYVVVTLVQILISIGEYYTVALASEAKEAENAAAGVGVAPPAR